MSNIEDVRLSFSVGGRPLHPATDVNDVLACLASVPAELDEFGPFYWPYLGYESDRRILPDGRDIVAIDSRWEHWSTPV